MGIRDFGDWNNNSVVFVIMGSIQIGSIGVIKYGLFIFIGIIVLSATLITAGHLGARLYHAIPAKGEIFQENTCLKIIKFDKNSLTAIVQKFYKDQKDEKDAVNKKRLYLLEEVPNYLDDDRVVIIDRKGNIQEIKNQKDSK